MSNKIIMAAPCCGSCDLRYVVTGDNHGLCNNFFNLNKVCKEYQPLNPVEVESDENIKLKQTLTEARKVLKNIWDNTEFCTCPSEGDCVCGQTELLNIMKKIDEVIE
jgi:hypothetical protein